MILEILRAIALAVIAISIVLIYLIYHGEEAIRRRRHEN
jgi:hypothetical protein